MISGYHPAPHWWKALAVDEEHVSVEHDLDEHQRGVEGPVGEKQQRQRNSERRKSVPERTVHARREERNDREREMFERRHDGYM